LVVVRVLVIDDAPDTRDLLRTVLEQRGAEVRGVGSAAQGLAEAKDWKPSIVVSDIGMPLEDGYDFIRKFREGAMLKDTSGFFDYVGSHDLAGIIIAKTLVTTAPGASTT
jgi:CheY-like chemotaxis protein